MHFTIEARTHGRYLVRVPATAPPWPLLVAIQALHPFYTRKEQVVASWMTRDDRELAIADNIDYVGRVLERVRQEHLTRPTLVFAGFSQGGAMAYRAAAHYRADGLIILAADVPPDVIARQNVPLPPILIGRGVKDDWYTEAKEAADVAALAKIGARVESCVFDGGHEWTDAFRSAAGAFLKRLAEN